MEKAEFEAIRKHAVEACNSRTKISVIGCIIIATLIVQFVFIFSRTGFVPITCFFAIILTLFFELAFYVLVNIFHPARTALTQYKAAYKVYIVHRSLASIFTNLLYYPDSGIPRTIVQAVMTGGDRYRSNDYITASYKGIRLTGADVHTEREHRSTDSHGHTTTTYTTIFKGKFFVFDFNRDFAERLQVIGKNFPGARLTYDRNNKNKYRKIETESVEFNKSFQVYGQSGQETFYILDPSFMEKLQAINLAYQGRVLFSFIDNKLIVAVHDNRDAFEPTDPRKFTDEQAEFNRINKDILSILQFVDVLMLDRYAFKGKK